MQFLIKFIKIKNIKIFYFYVSICLVMISSITYFGWSETWTMVRVPSMNPIFADMRTVQGGLLSHDDGLNPQVVNPHDPWKRAMNYPSIWLNIGRLLGLDKELNYILFCLIEIIAFLCVCGYLLYKSPSPLLLLSIISTASLLAIERGNNDLIIFSLIFLFSSISFLKISCVLIILSFVLKIYPLFSIGAMVVKRDKWLLALTLIPVALISFINYDDYFLTLSGVPAGGLAWNYGLPAIKSLLARMFPFTNLPFIILLIIIIVLVIIFIFILKKYNLQTKSSNLHYTLFLVGSCLYTGTYAFSSSFDYRLRIPLIPPLDSEGIRHPVPIQVARVFRLIPPPLVGA